MHMWPLGVEYPSLQSHVDLSPPHRAGPFASEDGSETPTDENLQPNNQRGFLLSPEDVDPQLRRVEWCVVRSHYGGDIGHYTFTSGKVISPEERCDYA
jgi:hypothetical protein